MREIPHMNGVPSKRLPADLNPFCEVRKHVYIMALEENATMNTLSIKRVTQSKRRLHRSTSRYRCTGSDAAQIIIERS